MKSHSLHHAFLIMTHGNFALLKRFLTFFDSENIDFFIHVDAHVKAFDFEEFRTIPKQSSVTFVDRIRISWGDYSIVKCEMMLLKAAAKGHYDYYHLLSGVDVPVKTRVYIEHYFDADSTINYINFQRTEITKEHLDRVKYFYPFQRFNIRNKKVRNLLRKATVAPQKLLRINRTKAFPTGYVFQKGTQWFSITDALAQYLVNLDESVLNRFRATLCPDEVFLHSIVMNSPFKDTLPPHAFNGEHSNCLRYIDWKRGNPYVFQDDDFDELTHTPENCLFARKFDGKQTIANRLYDYFSGEIKN